MSELLKIGEVAAKAAVSTRTIDYYTTLGLITPAERTEAGYRMYHPSTVDLVATIRHLETHHFSLDEIAHVLRNTNTIDLAALLSQLTTDLTALNAAVDTTDQHTHPALTLLTARAHALITAAIDIATTTPLV